MAELSKCIHYRLCMPHVSPLTHTSDQCQIDSFGKSLDPFLPAKLTTHCLPNFYIRPNSFGFQLLNPRSNPSKTNIAIAATQKQPTQTTRTTESNQKGFYEHESCRKSLNSKLAIKCVCLEKAAMRSILAKLWLSVGPGGRPSTLSSESLPGQGFPREFHIRPLNDAFKRAHCHWIRTVEGEVQRFGWTRVDGEDYPVYESGMTLWK